MKYSLGELRKTGAASVGTLVMIVAYLMENEEIAALFPPAWVAIAGAFITVLGVFGVPNARSKEERLAADRAVEAVEKVQVQVNDPAQNVSEVAVNVAVDAVKTVSDIINRLRPRNAVR